MKRGTGILMDGNNDLSVIVRRNANGFITQGLVVGNSTLQNQSMLLSMRKSELKHAPTVGVGISDALLDHDLLPWRQKIRQEFENDGLKVKTLTYNTPKELSIDAEY